MTQPSATGPVQPAARSVPDVLARFGDTTTTRATTTLAITDRVTITMDPQVAGLLTLLALVGLYTLWTTVRDWCADTYTTLRKGKPRT